MAINPQDLVQYAYELYCEMGNTCCELRSRTVVNRAYYGAFLTARDHAGITTSGGSIHAEVISYYQAKKMGKIGNNLDSLKRLRQKADYQPHDDIGIAEARSSCRTAQTILKEIQKINSSDKI